MARRVLPVLIALALAAGCTESKPPEPVKKAEAPKPPAAPVPAPAPPAPQDQVTASISGKSDPDCLAPLEDAAGTKPETVKLGKRQAEISGYKLTLKSKPDADDQVVVGVLGPINESSPVNHKLIEEYLKFFADKGVEVILAAGDVGDSKDSIQASLTMLGKSGLPVIAIAGNTEPRDGFRDALAAVHKASPNVINGNKVRRIEWDDVTFFTLPGLHDKKFLHEEDGAPRCQFFAEDVDVLADSIKTAPAPAMLVAHDPPAGKDPGAIDYIGEAKHHAGDLNLSKLIESSKIAFGVFPNIKEAGGKATADVAGAKVLKEGELADALYLNPGPADGTTRWEMNDGTTWEGGAAVVTIKGKQASYAMYRHGAAKPIAKDGP